jgi:hypothetical protein
VHSGQPQRRKVEERRPKADVSKRGVRWPRLLAACVMPPEWKAIDVKLLVLLVHKLD